MIQLASHFLNKNSFAGEKKQFNYFSAVFAALADSKPDALNPSQQPRHCNYTDLDVIKSKKWICRENDVQNIWGWRYSQAHKQKATHYPCIEPITCFKSHKQVDISHIVFTYNYLEKMFKQVEELPRKPFRSSWYLLLLPPHVKKVCLFVSCSVCTWLYTQFFSRMADMFKSICVWMNLHLEVLLIPLNVSTDEHLV